MNELEQGRGACATPRVVESGAEALACVRAARAAGKRVGLIPTMGALHEGHASLVRAARRECDEVVTTIFVNPTQFGPQEDFGRYPRTLPQDLEVLREAGADWVFVPSVETMYRPGSSTFVDPPRVAQRWEGERRPGHFRGVATVVLKLFHLLPTDVAYFGAKDYQQSLVIRHLVADLDVPIEISVQPTVREPDGLAMSSRNRYLSPEERTRALAISRGLHAAQTQWRAGCRDAAILSRSVLDQLAAGGVAEVEYAAVADADTLEPTAYVERRAVVLVAARVGATRLIDNMMLE
ncbi:MAG: pantoate--beta-alanine ligase [Pirellulales bacterium]